MALAYQSLARAPEAERALRDLIERESFGSAYQIAQVYVLRGELETAFQWLDRAYRQRDGGFLWLKTDPLLEPIRLDPRFRDLLRKMKFPET